MSRLITNWRLLRRMMFMPKIFPDPRKRNAVPIALALTWFALASFSTGASSQPDVIPPSADESMLFADIPSVFGASKYEQRLGEAPSSVTIITADEIKKYGHRTLADILRSVRGMYVTNDRNYSFIGVRGFGRPTDYNSRVQLTIDGHRTSDSVYGMSMFGSEGILDLDVIDRIEVIRGPSSSLYGSNALFAVVNVVTKRGRDYRGFEVAIDRASLDTSGARVTYGNRFSDSSEVVAQFSSFYSAGHSRIYYPEWDDPATNNGVYENNDQERGRNAFLRAAHGNFSFEAAVVDRFKAVPTASWIKKDWYDPATLAERFNNPNNGTQDTRYFLTASYDKSWDDHSRLSVSLSYDKYIYRGVYTDGGDGSMLYADHTDARGWTGEAQFTAPIGEQHKLVVGTELQANNHQDQWGWNVDPYSSATDEPRSSQLWSVYAQDEWRIGTAIIVNVGVRHDNYPVWGGTTNPRLALIYQINTETDLKLMYGQAFRAPSYYELYYYKIKSTWLKPEIIRTTELAFEHTLRSGLRSVVSVYQYRVTDLINESYDSQNNLIFLNGETAVAHGVEVETEGHFTPWLDGRASYSLQRARDKMSAANQNETLSNSPEQLAKVGLTVPLFNDRLSASLEAQYTSSRRTVQDTRVSPFTIFNFTLLHRRWISGFELSASVYNLTGQHFADPAGEEFEQSAIQQDGRNYRMKVQYEF
jgi:iron complex outermembrane receptor protein